MRRSQKQTALFARQREAQRAIQALGFFGGAFVSVQLLGGTMPRAIYRKRKTRARGKVIPPAVQLMLPHSWPEMIQANGLAVVGNRFVLDAERKPTPEGMDECWLATTIAAPPHSRDLDKRVDFLVKFGGEWFRDSTPHFAARRALAHARAQLFPEQNPWAIPF